MNIPKPIMILPRIFLFLVLITSALDKAKAQYDQQAIKSAYLERFTRFIEWPTSNGPDTSRHFIIGLVNGNDFGKVLSDVFSYRQILGKEVRFIVLEKPEDLSLCRLCYINGLRKQQLDQYAIAAGKFGVLLVGDSHGYGKSGVHFNFVVIENKIKFEINENALKASGFKVSHLLYKSGIIL